MWDRFRERVGVAGLVVGVAALVMALVGGAYAAGGGLSGKQKKEVQKISKKFAGQAGAQGAAGAAGKDGAKGAAGKDGANGTNGKDGASVKVTAATALQCEERGGAIVEAGGNPSSAQEVCVGKKGDPGVPGQPWTPDNNLPKGAALTGVWAFSGNLQKITTEVEGVKEEVTVGVSEINAPLSFPVKLSAPLEETKVHFQYEPNFGDFDEGGLEVIGCEGSNALPSAPEGHLCVYSVGSELENATFADIRRSGGGIVGAGRAGAVMRVILNGGPSTATGTWAVTGS